MRWPRELLTEKFPCGHPRTEANTYEVYQCGTEKRNPRTIRRCKTCTVASAKKSYEKRTGRLAAEIMARSFCRRCAAGGCGVWHRRDHVDARCLDPVSLKEDALACSCGAAWGRTWKAEVDAQKTRAPKNAKGRKAK